MHPSQRAAKAWLPLQPSQHADGFSFPPTQRTGLLGSTVSDQKHHRSQDQGVNLQDSFHRLLDALGETNLQQCIVA